MNKNKKSELIQMLALADSEGANHVVNLLLKELIHEFPSLLQLEWRKYNNFILEDIAKEGKNKIQWIKLFREHIYEIYGISIGLKEAKEIADERFEQ